tara:strand:- start:497 stop:1000 length:504 start_codon:yes stop_codon:yes gene_type:complete
MGFVSDRIKGEKAEDSVSRILSCLWDVCKASEVEKGAFSDWDLSVSQVGTGYEVFTVEVKYDEMQSKTGNIAIEIYNPRSGKPSGLTATKASLWCHVLQDSIWITSIDELKKFCEDVPPFKSFNSVGDGNASILLYKTEDILKIFERIDKCSKIQLQQKIHSLLKLV